MAEYEMLFYYKDKNKNRIPIYVSGGNTMSSALWLSESIRKHICEEYPQAIGNLYVLFYGKEFKLEADYL